MTTEGQTQTTSSATRVEMPLRRFENRLDRARVQGQKEVLDRLPEIVKEQLGGLDPAEIKEFLASRKQTQATPPAEKPPTKADIAADSPQKPGETRVDYEARLKELLKEERASWQKEVDEQRAADRKELEEIKNWRKERETEAEEAQRQADYQAEWTRWQSDAKDRAKVNPKYLDLVEADAQRWVNGLAQKNPDHKIFDEDATDADLQKVWDEEFYAPRRAKFPEMFAAVTPPPAPRPGQTQQRMPPAAPAAGSGQKDVMAMTDEEYRAHKKAMGL